MGKACSRRSVHFSLEYWGAVNLIPPTASSHGADQEIEAPGTFDDAD